MFLPTVGTPPELGEPLKDQVVVSPTTAKLSCTIPRGDPEAKITWYKNGRELTADKRIVMSAVEADVSLTINDSVPNDAANYRVEAANKLGRVETACNLDVHCKWMKCIY